MGRGGRIAIAAAYAAALGAGCSLFVETKGLSGGGGDGSASLDADASLARDGPGGDVVVADASGDGAAATRYRDAVLADGPILYLRLGESSGPTARDESGNGHDGRYRSGCTFGAKGALAGDPNTAVRIGGSACAIDVPDVDFSGTSPFTLEAWALHEGADATYRHVFNKDAYPPAGREQWGVYLQSANRLVFERYVGGEVHACSSPTPPEATFFHVVATFDGFVMRIYVDGQERDTANDTRSQAPKNVPLIVGAHSTTGQWKGVLDEIAVYPTALAALAIKRHYDLGRGP